jgi:hypothetical protein
VALWSESSTNAIEIPAGKPLVELIFIYKEEIKKGMSSALNWGDTNKDVGGRLLLGKTEMYDQDLNPIELTLINGELKN